VAKKKLIRFEEINSFPNVIQPSNQYPLEDHPIKGNWGKLHFRNNKDNLILEIGCGKGEYTLALAQAFTSANYIGIDIKGDRIWCGATEALSKKNTNVAFLRIQAQRLTYYFAPNEVSEIWLTFPDPHHQKSRERMRLTSPEFFNRYQKILKPQGIIHLKTDHQQLFQYTLNALYENKHTIHFCTDDLYNNNESHANFLTENKTYYESMFSRKGFTIKYVKFSLNPDSQQSVI